jgi:hypothetical protein
MDKQLWKCPFRSTMKRVLMQVLMQGKGYLLPELVGCCADYAVEVNVDQIRAASKDSRNEQEKEWLTTVENLCKLKFDTSFVLQNTTIAPQWYLKRHDVDETPTGRWIIGERRNSIEDWVELVGRRLSNSHTRIDVIRIKNGSESDTFVIPGTTPQHRNDIYSRCAMLQWSEWFDHSKYPIQTRVFFAICRYILPPPAVLLGTKSGRFRATMMGKRGDFTHRAVIGSIS